MAISSEPTNGTEEAVAAIMAAIKRFVELMAEKADALIAAAVPDEEWAALVREGIAPHLGAEFIATAAASLPPAGKRPRSMSDRIRQTDGLLAWPEGVEGPSTVQALLDEYPSTFSGINADDVRIVISSPSWTQKFNTYMRDSINLVEGMSDTVFADMQAALSKVGQGATSFDKQKVVREALSWEEEGGYVGWMRRAETIARTETAVARNSAAHAAALETASSGIPVSKRWVAAADERTRPDHAAAHGTLRDVHEAFDVGGEPLQFPGDREHGSAGQTINCVVGSTMVAGPGQGVATCYRRPFTGVFIHLTLGNGGVLTCTPNHPVLTPAGYVAAGDLGEGECVMATLDPWEPDVNNAPPRIDEAFDSVRALRDSLRVPGGALDFHGDGTEGEEVEVIPAEGILREDFNAAFGGHFGEHVLVRSGHASSGLPGSGSADGGVSSVGPLGLGGGDALTAYAPTGSVGGGGLFPALRGGELGCSDAVSFTLPSNGESEKGKSTDYSGSRASETARHLQDAHALGMQPTEIVGINRYRGTHDVFNLETDRGYYIANGVMIHNCRCVCTYLEDFTAQEAEDFNRELDEWDDISLEELERQMDEELNGVTASGDVQAKAWAGQLAPRGEPTGDGRIFTGDGDFRFREFPLPLLWQESTGEGHDASRVVGTIDRGEITDEGFMAEGTVFADEEKVLALLERGVIRPSVDLCDMVADVFAAEDDEDGQEMLHVTSATVMAATLVAKPAFENVNVTLTGEDATAEVDSLAASAGVVLSTYDATMFDDPGLDAPTPLTVTDDGRVVGHLALWDSCHVGMPGRCVKPPKSASGYASFHQSTVRTDRGNLAVGRLTVGGGHASPRDGFRAAAEHYDTTGAAWAMVRAGEDKFGIWVAGQVHPDATDAQVNAGASAPLSGDWRRIGGGMELVAALSVSTPGFPVRREYTSEQGDSMSLVAAAEVSADHHGGVLPGKESDPNDVSGAYKAMAEYALRKAQERDQFSDLEKTPIGWRRKEQNMAVNVSALTDEQAGALAARLAPHIDKHNSRQSARVRAKKAEAALRSEKRERTLRRAEQVFGSKTGGEK